MKYKSNFAKFVYSLIKELYYCDITDFSRMPPEREAYKMNKNKSELFTVLFKFAQTFLVLSF